MFGEAGRHARSAVGVAELPLGAPVEVELVVELADERDCAGSEPDGACHDLLVRLAGRLPDRLLWRLREWLATGGQAAVAALAPAGAAAPPGRAHRDERDLLEEAVADRAAPRRLLDAVLTVSVPDEPAAVFQPGPADPDLAALSLLAVARGDDGCVELRQAVRIGDGRTAAGARSASSSCAPSGRRPWVLAATLAAAAARARRPRAVRRGASRRTTAPPTTGRAGRLACSRRPVPAPDRRLLA